MPDSPPSSDAPDPNRQPAIRVVAMPADTNPAGDIFGGWLMSQMDLAAGQLAMRVAKGRAATIAADAMVFHSPVSVGDEVSVYADVVGRGRTSVRVHVEAWRRARHSEESNKVTEAVFTFVKIGADRRPEALPPEE